MPEIKKEIAELAGIISGNIEVGEHGALEIAKDTYEKTLEGTDLDMKTVKKVQQHNTNFVAATDHAVAEKGLELFGQDKELASVTAKASMGGDRYKVQFNASEERPGKDGNETVHGTFVSSYTVGAAGHKGQLKAVREHFADEAKSLLGE